MVNPVYITTARTNTAAMARACEMVLVAEPTARNNAVMVSLVIKAKRKKMKN